ncbi:DEHA2C15422p [Debaryomyces hansenii CBS767]|uniref:DEHA2C15422p n=1 Tax=Debaryomyces hansenii (strain ATCC 36239 / CBS 767 / BCRC 21394 / JCM 1990 / NBRC 0083 / IGC 2968) TaxID=284592 RepID=Q6BTW4_DEBHA|nr:DEHA2C15422p [Debaryomyces hansenii CBS767]CAG86437.2 DEHA2C15422p [Debaryomyces hansenii CBS767]|eukprot:XP_458355.2 DEHA2C15422p [Debaryomyces hansenii CBS767]
MVMDQFRIYIFDKSHKYVVEEWPEFDNFLEDEVDYIQVRDVNELKEDLLNRKFQTTGRGEYGIMLARNKCEVHNFYYGFDNCYIEDEYSVGFLSLHTIGHGLILHRIRDRKHKEWSEICPSENYNTVRIYTYNNQRLNIESTKIRYIDVSNEDDIKKDLLHKGFELSISMILGEDIKIKDISEGYKTYKVITEKEIEDRMEDIMSESYDVL